MQGLADRTKLLNPAYDVDGRDIEELIKTTIKKEYPF